MIFLNGIAQRARPERLLGPIGRTGLSDAILLALIVFAMAFPLISIRGFHYEEGLTAALAKDALSGSPWYVPDLFGARWVERPVLQSWIVAAISWPLGGVTQFTTRLPGVVALYAGALIIVQFVRPRASRAASLVAALCFMFSPAVLQKVITAEADVILSVFQFAAFVVWWRGFETGRITFRRWLAVGLLLAATALFKGPQPAAYFALGIGAFILIKRDWRQVSGYVLAGIVSLAVLASWYVAVYQAADTGTLLMYMRLSSHDALSDYLLSRLKFTGALLTFLPGLVIAAPTLLAITRRRETVDIEAHNRTLLQALVLYAGVATLALLVWPGAATRYAMPALPAVAAIAGLAFDRLVARRIDIARAALAILAMLVAYQIAWGWIAAPLFPDAFRRSRIDAQTVEAATRAKPYAIYAQLRLDDAMLAYLDRPVRYLPEEELPMVVAPYYLLAQASTIAAVAVAHPDFAIVRHATLRREGLALYEVQPSR